MRRDVWSRVMLVAVAAAGCGGGRSAVDVAAATPRSTTTVATTMSRPSTTNQVVPVTTATGAPATTAAPSSTVPMRTTTTGARAARPAGTSGAPTPAPATVATTTSTTAGTTTTTAVATTTTTAPLPVPVLLDARQGFGTPCEPASTRNPQGCFFFVYATPGTRGSFHRIHSDAAFRTESPLGTNCGTQSPHHSGEDTCSWYLGPVYGRTAGQQECWWATTVLGDRESEPSNRVCLTWADQAR